MVDISAPRNDESTALAYETALRSYDWALRRIDAWDGNLDKLLAWGTPLPLAVIGTVAARINSNSYQDWTWVGIALAFMISAIGAAFWGKFAGHIQLISPTYLLNNWLNLPKGEYHFYAIKYAGLHLDNNTKLVERKAKASTIAALCFIAAGVAGAIAWFSAPVT